MERPRGTEVGEENAAHLSRLLDCTDERPDLLRGQREDDFISVITTRFALYGERTWLSAKQRAWLNDIWLRYREAGLIENAEEGA